MINRRKFAGLGLISIGSAISFPAGLLARGIVESDTLDTPNLAFSDSGLTLFPGVPLNESRSKAEALLSSKFYILIGDVDVVEAKLIEVNDHESTLATEGFSMVFFTRWGPEIDEGLYSVEEPSLGYFPLYLRPVDRGASDGYFYEVSAVHLVADRI